MKFKQTRKELPVMKDVVSADVIKERIFIIRGHKVMVSGYLAKLYGVETKVLVQAVKRNIERFPADFMFRLTWDEIADLKAQNMAYKKDATPSRSQNVTLKKGQNVKYLPYAFTEQGVAMLSSVLRSRRAIQVNISIMRAFVQFRQILAANKDLSNKLNDLERKIGQHDKEIHAIFEAIRRLMAQPGTPKRKIGFHS